MGNTIFALFCTVLGYSAAIVKDIINNRHELKKIKFAKLNEKQACVIAELYSKIVEVNEKAMALFSPVGTMKPEERLPIANALGDAVVELLKFYRPNEIYLSDSTCNLINELLESLKIAGEYSVYLRFRQDAINEEERKAEAHNERDAWKKGYSSIQKDGIISNILKQLKTELRGLIGVV